MDISAVPDSGPSLVPANSKRYTLTVSLLAQSDVSVAFLAESDAAATALVAELGRRLTEKFRDSRLALCISPGRCAMKGKSLEQAEKKAGEQ